MRVLFLHPEDSPWRGEWAGQRWDLIVDIGFASSSTYAEWSRRLGTRILSVHEFSGQTDSYRWVDQVLESGRGRLLDRLGLDWWEIVGASFYKDIQLLHTVGQLRAEVAADHLELAATRPDLLTRLFARMQGCAVHYFRSASEGPFERSKRALRSMRRLDIAQIAEIALDKWDPCYGMRRYWAAGQRAALTNPVVLLPSAYSNVTRSVLAYAAQLPQRRFLLATTRKSAVPTHLPDNVCATSLSAYAVPFSASSSEAAELKTNWDTFFRSMADTAEAFRSAADAGIWDHFPQHIENGLRLRDAWKHLLDLEPVKGVLCGDDLNYYTRIPLILARRCGLNAVYCSHGALDGGFLFKQPFAETFLVKGEMESDYLRRVRAFEAERIRVAAPGASPSVDSGEGHSDALVFFSQPYEVAGARMDEIYRELVPRLWSAAQRSGHRLIVKLHPFESVRARQALIASILPRSASDQVEIVRGVAPESVMSRAWCGFTIDSSVAVECALRRIPFFLSGWLDFNGMGYLQQFARFGVAHVLPTPESIEQIPELVAAFRDDPLIRERLWCKADSKLLDEIMFGTREVRSPDACAC